MLERFESPKAKCEYPFIQKPSIDKKGKIKDRYKINLILDKENPEHVEFIKHVNKLVKESPGDRSPIKKHLDENDNPTGYGVVTFVSNAQFKDGTTKEPIPTYDSKANLIKRDNNFIANGSVVKVNWSPFPYEVGESAGLSLLLNGVQIIELIEWEGVKFAEEDGYVAEKKDDLFSGSPDPREKSTLEEEGIPEDLW